MKTKMEKLKRLTKWRESINCKNFEFTFNYGPLISGMVYVPKEDAVILTLPPVKKTWLENITDIFLK